MATKLEAKLGVKTSGSGTFQTKLTIRLLMLRRIFISGGFFFFNESANKMILARIYTNDREAVSKKKQNKTGSDDTMVLINKA